jgi:LPXTG-motif cell wall-anchored protein
LKLKKYFGEDPVSRECKYNQNFSYPAPAPAPATETATPEPVTETEDGGQLPRTDNSWVLTFLVGVILLAVGTVYMVLRRRRI